MKQGNENPVLRDFCQRYYDPQIGRFMSLDPQDSPASSPYAYCANNPLKFTHPTGMDYERIPWDFTEEQWSWIEQNMMRASSSIPEIGGYDRMFWMRFRMMKLENIHDIQEALRGIDKYITAQDEEEAIPQGDVPLEQEDIDQQVADLLAAIPALRAIVDLIEFRFLVSSFLLEDKWAVWTEKITGGAWAKHLIGDKLTWDLFEVHIYRLVAYGYVPKALAHEICEVGYIFSLRLPWGERLGPAHFMTIDKLREWQWYWEGGW